MHKYTFNFYTKRSAAHNPPYELTEIVFANSFEAAKNEFDKITSTDDYSEVTKFEHIRSNEMEINRFQRFILTSLAPSEAATRQYTYFLYEAGKLIEKWYGDDQRTATDVFEYKKQEIEAAEYAYKIRKDHGFGCYCGACMM